MPWRTASPSGDSLVTWISVDANALIDHVRESALHDLGIPTTSPEANALRVRLGQERDAIVAKTAYGEAQRNLKKDLAHNLDGPEFETVLDRARNLLSKCRRTMMRSDRMDYVGAAQSMYAAINADSTNKKLAKWKRKKAAYVVDPVLGSDINDLKILSTTAYFARRNRMEFWTRDMDFTMFADEIHKALGVTVVDTRRLLWA